MVVAARIHSTAFPSHLPQEKRKGKEDEEDKGGNAFLVLAQFVRTVTNGLRSLSISLISWNRDRYTYVYICNSVLFRVKFETSKYHRIITCIIRKEKLE